MVELASKRAVLTAAAGLSLFACLCSAAQEQAAEVPAIWKTQEITFFFQSFTTYYSCSGLERKLERVMHVLGTKADVRVRSVECPNNIASMPRVIMQVTSPVEATPEALAERDKDKSKRELTARVQGKNPEEGMEQFPARWKRVSLGQELRLEPGDCELIEELRRKVLPKLAVRIVSQNLQCPPHSVSIVRPKIEVETLVEIPKPDEAPPAEPTRQKSGDQP